MSAEYESKIREVPRISVNKLGQYIVARPSRRRRILTDQRKPRTYQVIWYEYAARAIREFVTRGKIDRELFMTEITRLTNAEPYNRYSNARFKTNVAAMEAFLESCEELPLDNMEMVEANPNPPQVRFGGVGISVRPDLILTGKNKNGEPQVGCLKLHMSKSHPLDDATGLYIATVLQRFSEQHLMDYGNPNPSMAIVLDVFEKKYYTAPRHFKRRMEDITAACEEIVLRWESVANDNEERLPSQAPPAPLTPPAPTMSPGSSVF